MIGLFILIIVILLFLSMRKRYELCVAKFKEDITWTNKYENVKVYDKSIGDLPNIGRESHTYLTYLVDHYHDLPDVVFFTQGQISDRPYKDYDFINIQHFSKNFQNIKSNEYFGSNTDHLYEYAGAKMDPIEELGFRDWFTTYIDGTHDINDSINYWQGAIFSVSRDRILSRPHSYYKKLLSLIPPGKDNPEIGHFFERSWFYIFNCHKLI